MSQQYDLLAGLDISSLSSVTQEQFNQAINQLAPLQNIGLVIEGTTRPDLTNNPRFIRYFWLDISTPANPLVKRYTGDRTAIVDSDASWETVGVGEDAILTTMIAPRSATGGVAVEQLKLNEDYSATPSEAFYVLRVAANGKDIEVVSLDDVIADNGGIALSGLRTNGLAANKYLGVVAGALAYKYLAGTDFSETFNNRIPVETALLPGTALYIPRTNAAGTAIEWIEPDDAFDVGGIDLDRLAQEGAALDNLLRWTGTQWAPITQSVRVASTAVVSTTGILSGADISQQVHTVAHGLGAIPKLVDVRLRQTDAVADCGYDQNDEISVLSFRAATGNVQAAICCDATNVSILFMSSIGEIPNKITGNLDNTITETKWFPIVRAWL